jgi:hypothetical protein
LQGKLKYSEKTCPSAPDRSGGKPATNRLSYGAAERTLRRTERFVLNSRVA